MRFENSEYMMMQSVPTIERVDLAERNAASSPTPKSVSSSVDLSSELYYFNDITIEKANEILKTIKKVKYCFFSI
jgi:hypothetical protein